TAGNTPRQQPCMRCSQTYRHRLEKSPSPCAPCAGTCKRWLLKGRRNSVQATRKGTAPRHVAAPCSCRLLHPSPGLAVSAAPLPVQCPRINGLALAEQRATAPPGNACSLPILRHVCTPGPEGCCCRFRALLRALSCRPRKQGICAPLEPRKRDKLAHDL